VEDLVIDIYLIHSIHSFHSFIFSNFIYSRDLFEKSSFHHLFNLSISAVQNLLTKQNSLLLDLPSYRLNNNHGIPQQQHGRRDSRYRRRGPVHGPSTTTRPQIHSGGWARHVAELDPRLCQAGIGLFGSIGQLFRCCLEIGISRSCGNEQSAHKRK
jgi:hypothetical protein